MARRKRALANFDISIELQPKQRQLFDLATHSPCGWLSYGGAKGGAKSGGVRRILLALLFQHPGSKALLVRKTWDEVYKNHVIALWEEYPQLEPLFNKSDKILTLPNGSQLHLGYGESEGDVRRYNGVPFEWIAVDQSEEFPLSDLQLLRSCNRTRIPGVRPKIILTFNPGGTGHVYHKRLFIDREFVGNEKSSDFAPMLYAFPWDNIEWCRPALAEAGLTADDYYYRFSEKERKAWFLRSEYGKTLLGLDNDLRAKYLDGDWNIAAGQYFGKSFKPWPYYRVSKDGALALAKPPGNLWGPNTWPVDVKPWVQRWISMDYGYIDNSAVYWWFWDGETKFIEREWVFNELECDAIARGIFERSEGKRIHDFVLSHDCFLRTSSPISRADQIAAVLKELNVQSERESRITPGTPLTYVPTPRPAPKDRVNRNTLMSQELTNCKLLIHESCTGLIRKLPMAIRDPDNDGDYIGFNRRQGSGGGDDELDGAGYGITVTPSQVHVPRDVQLAARITATEPNHIAMQVLQVRDELRRKGGGAPFSWRGQPYRRYA